MSLRSRRAGVVTVKLDNNDVGDAGARALAAALARGHALGALWLRGNARIGAAGTSALTAAARANPTAEVAADPAPPGSGGGGGDGDGSGSGGDGGVLPLDFAGAERLRAGLTAHAFVMFGREQCEACAALGEQWSQLAAVLLLVDQLVEMAAALGDASGVWWGWGGWGVSRLPLRAQACPLAPERPARRLRRRPATLPPVSEHPRRCPFPSTPRRGGSGTSLATSSPSSAGRLATCPHSRPGRRAAAPSGTRGGRALRGWSSSCASRWSSSSGPYRRAPAGD